MHKQPLKRGPQRQSGLSIIETLVAVAIAAAATGSVVPGFQQALETRRLDGAAAQLHTDLQLARSQAAAQNRNLRVSFQTGAAGSCYVVHDGGASDCQCAATGVPVCTPGTSAFRSVHLEPGGLRLQGNLPSMVFDAAKGTASPAGTVRLVARDGRAVHLVVNIMGRVRECTPGAALRGYPNC